jgi:hypothetical protein
MIIPAPSTGAGLLPAHTLRISDFGLNSDITISRRIEGGANPIVRAQLIAKADAADADENAILLKTISPALTSAGQITDTGASSRVAAIQFELSPIETAQLTTTSYYAISATDSAGNLYVLERGILTAAVPTVTTDIRSSARASLVMIGGGGIPQPVVIPRPYVGGGGEDQVIGGSLAQIYSVENTAIAPWTISNTSLEPPRGGARDLTYEVITDVQQGEDYTLSRWIRVSRIGELFGDSLWKPSHQPHHQARGDAIPRGNRLELRYNRRRAWVY